MVSPIAERIENKLIQEDVSLKDLTTWHVGGPARFFCRPNYLDELREAVKFARENDLKYRIIGNGSNVLVPDEGYDGLVISLGNGLGKTEFSGNTVKAGGGAPLYKLVTTANEAGSQCLNFLTGIPGTVGGGIAMNAGACGREISDYLKSLTYMDERGDIRTVSDFSGTFGYRESPFQGSGKLVLAAEFELDYEEEQPDMKQLLQSRREKIPFDKHTAGSVFKNPTNHEKTAGELLDDAGSKGLGVGDAVVSSQHANFILNKGHATAKNIQNTIDIARNRVYKEFGVTLVTEIVVI